MFQYVETKYATILLDLRCTNQLAYIHINMYIALFIFADIIHLIF